jgi:NfeD-like C-terminal, partner-binding
MSLIVAPETIEFFPQAAIGEVEQTVTRHQRGRVKFMATTWFARFYHPSCAEALPGMPVRVIGREGLTLLVVPIGDEEFQPQRLVADRLEVNPPSLLWLIQRVSSRFATWLSE